MQEGDVENDAPTMVTLVNFCANLATLEHGKQPLRCQEVFDTAKKPS